MPTYLMSVRGVCAGYIPGAVGPFGVAGTIHRYGWARWIDEEMEPDYEWLKTAGTPRMMIHTPHAWRNGNYWFDQAVIAADNGLPTARDFVKAWRPFTARAQVIAYIGTLHDDRLSAMKDAPRRTLDTWWRRMVESLAPYIDAGMSIGFDYSTDWPADSAEYGILSTARALVESYGGQCFLEARPYGAGYEHLHDWPVFTQESVWFTSDPILNPSGAGVNATNAMLTGEIVRYIDMPTGGWGGTVAQVAARFHADYLDVRAAGHTAAGTIEHLRQSGYTATQYE